MAEAARKMNIYEAISRCMEEIGAVGKDAVNKQQGFKYRGIDAVMNAINPALVKNRVFIVPEVLDQKRQERTTNKGAVLFHLPDKIYVLCRGRIVYSSNHSWRGHGQWRQSNQQGNGDRI